MELDRQITDKDRKNLISERKKTLSKSNALNKAENIERKLKLKQLIELSRSTFYKHKHFYVSIKCLDFMAAQDFKWSKKRGILVGLYLS